MRPHIKAEWVAALRSGEFEQGKGRLAQNGEYCCLGVLCELAVREGVVQRWTGGSEVFQYGEETNYLPVEVMDWAGVSRVDPSIECRPLSHMNDCGVPFIEIADAIEKHL